MTLVKKSLVLIICLVLIFCFIGLAALISLDKTLSDTSNVKQWAKQVGLYTDVLNLASNNISSSLNNPGLAKKIDPYIAQSLKLTYTRAQFSKDINIIVNANYVWLSGKTNKPIFKINFNNLKTSLANILAKDIQGQYEQLPNCNLDQLLTFNSSDVFAAGCQTSFLGPNKVYKAAVTAIQNGRVFKNDSFTQDSLVIKDHRPYYESYKLKGLLTKLRSYIVILAVVLCLLLLCLFLSLRKLFKSLLFLGFSAVIAGLVATLSLVFKAGLMQNLVSVLDKNLSLGLFRASIVSFVDKMASYTFKTTFTIGLVYIGFGLLIIILYFITSNRYRLSRLIKNVKS